MVVSDIFYFHPYLGKWSNSTHIFQMGWNHQPDLHLFGTGQDVQFDHGISSLGHTAPGIAWAAPRGWSAKGSTRGAPFRRLFPGRKPHLFGMGFSTPREDEQINIEPEDDGFGRCFSEFPGGVRILRFQPLIFWGVSIFVGRWCQIRWW